MKTLIRNSALYTFALFAISYIFSGVKISGGPLTIILGGTVLAMLSFFLRPILNVLTLPLNLLTFGTFSLITNALILYLLTIIISSIQIVPFTFYGFSFAGFIIPSVSLNTFFAYIVCSLVLSVIISVLHWIVH